jgi:ABC-type uncharacterized transport system ATPase subunit
MTDHVGTVVEDLADGGRTVLLATHDLGTVDRVADTVLVLDRGGDAHAGSHGIRRRRPGTGNIVLLSQDY